MGGKERFLLTAGSSLSLTGQGGLEQWRKVWEDLGPSSPGAGQRDSAGYSHHRHPHENPKRQVIVTHLPSDSAWGTCAWDKALIVGQRGALDHWTRVRCWAEGRRVHDGLSLPGEGPGMAGVSTAMRQEKRSPRQKSSIVPT